MKKSLLLLIILLLFSTTIFGQSGAACWRVISAGTNFTMAIKSDNTLWAWGVNSNKLGLGLGNLANQNLPIQVGTDNNWLTVSAGAVHTLAVKTTGTLWAWGDGQFGQLGNGIFNSATPNLTQIGTATDWVDVSAGNRFSLAIKNIGGLRTLWSWGLNNNGQLGLNNIIDQNLPVQVGTATDWQRVDAGNQHSLGVKTTGTLWAWGNNTFGQFGDGTNTNSLFPIQVGTSTNWSIVSAGFDHSMALDTGGILFTFGNNINGQLCDGTNTASNVPVPVSFSNPGVVSQYIAISAGNTFSLAIRNDNTLWSGGFNSTGQLGLGNNTAVNTLNQIGTGNTWSIISAGDAHSLAMDSSAGLSSTGRNLEGALGIGTFVFSYNTLQSVSCPTTPLETEEIIVDNNKTKIYPNPTSGIVNINYTLEKSLNVTIRVTNIQGQIIHEIKMEKTSNLNNDIIDLSNQSSGIYFMTILNEKGSFTSKIIKE
jgi:alpha-tubulin suppressor-like RCC1 family protein